MSYSNPTETLGCADIWSVASANRAFGGDKSLLVARPGKLFWKFPLFWFPIPEGFYALVTRHGAVQEYKSADGTKTPVWPAGVHMGPPWLKVSHLVTKQSMVFNTPVQGCKTKDNVTVEIDIALVLRVMGDADRPGDDPWNVYKFVHEVTARGLEDQLKDAQAEAVRTLARSMTHTEVYGLRSVSQAELTGFRRASLGLSVPPVAPVKIAGVGLNSVEEEKFDEEEKEEERDMVGEHDELDPVEATFNTEAGASITEVMKTRLNKQFKPQGVEILDVIIQEIVLPDDIQKQMSNKTMVISQNAEQRMQQRYDLLSLHQTEAIKTLKQKHQEIRDEIQKDGDLGVLREEFKLKEEKAMHSRVIKQIQTETKNDVARIKAESDEHVQQIRDRAKLAAEEVIEKSIAAAMDIRVSSEAERKELLAKADYEFAKLRATGDKALFKAEGVSAPLLRTLNDHLVESRKIQAQDKMASNEKLIITGTSGGEAANRLIMAEAALNESRGYEMNQESVSAVLSQVAVASGSAQVRLNV